MIRTGADFLSGYREFGKANAFFISRSSSRRTIAPTVAVIRLPRSPPALTAQEAKQVAAQQSPDDPDDQVAPKAEPAPLEDLSG